MKLIKTYEINVGDTNKLYEYQPELEVCNCTPITVLSIGDTHIEFYRNDDSSDTECWSFEDFISTLDVPAVVTVE